MQKINLIMLLVTILVCAIVLEVFLRVLMPQQLNIYQYDDDFIFEFRPYANYTFFDNEIKNSVVFNSKGFHDFEFVGGKNILLLGDSMIAGMEVSIEDTMAKVLEELMGFKVINAGVSGYSTEQQLLYLKNKGIKYNPEFVILAYYAGNDQTDNLERNLFTIKNDGLLLNEEKFLSYSKLRSLYYGITARSHLANLIVKVYFQLKELIKPKKPIEYTSINKDFIFLNYYLKNETEFSKKAWLKTELLIKEMKNYLDQQNKKFFIVIIPEQTQEDYNIGKTLLSKYNLKDSDVVWDLPQQKVKSIGKKYNISVINLLDTFIANNRQKLHFNSDFHWTKQGHELAGKTVGEKLKKLIK